MNNNLKIDDLNNSDEPIREILGKSPSWLIQCGNSLLFIFLILVFILSILIKYPETIYTNVTLSSLNAPKPIIALSSGKLVDLFVKDNQEVKKGQIIGFLESNGNHKEILYLESVLDSLEKYVLKTEFKNLSILQMNSFAGLGEIQKLFESFLKSYQQFNDYMVEGFYYKKLYLLQKQYDKITELKQHLIKQRKIYSEELALIEKNYEVDKNLKNQKVISEYDYRNEKGALLEKQLLIPQINAEIVSNENQQIEKLKEIEELKNLINQQKILFLGALNSIRSDIEDWKRKYILSSMVDGTFTFSSFLQENQQVSSNEIIGYVNSFNSQYYGEVYIPQFNLGKVEVGQKVILKFSAFPFQEYGIVYGQLSYVSDIVSNEGYLAKINFPQGLTTNHNKKIRYKEGLSAQGEIITKDLTLLQRFYYNIIKVLKR